MAYKSTIKTDKYIEVFNHDVDHKIFRARRTDPSVRNVPQPMHPMVGKTLIRKSNNEKCFVESVNKQFHAGWYYGALLNFNGSHAFMYFENISSMSEVVIACVKAFKQEFKECKDE